jgi:hydrogenase maturation protease
MKTLVIGLGNPILGDDGVGWKVAEELRRYLNPDLPVDADCLSLGGISLMEHLIGYQRAILIDAFSSDAPVGTISVMKLGDMPNYSAFHITSAHNTSLQNAIELGKSMGAQLPEDITVVGIATKHIYEFGEQLSAPVARVVPLVMQIVLDLLRETAIA